MLYPVQRAGAYFDGYYVTSLCILSSHLVGKVLHGRSEFGNLIDAFNVYFILLHYYH